MVEPFAHQKKAVEIMRERAFYGFFWSCGTGKTIAMLLGCKAIPMKTVVLAPRSILRSAWQADGEKVGVEVEVIHGKTPAERKKRIRRSKADVLVTTYDLFRTHADDFIEAGFRRLILDESSKIKGATSKTTKRVLRVATHSQIQSVYCLSATPAPNNPTEYWGQLRAIRATQRSAAEFFRYYARPIFQKRGEHTVILGYRQTSSQREALQAVLDKHTWALDKEDCLDMPDQVDVDVPVKLGKSERNTYRREEQALEEALESGQSKVKCFGSLARLRQISGGFLLEAGVPQTLGESKLAALSEIMDSIGDQEPAVIWAHFTAEIERLTGWLAERGRSVGRIDGKTSNNADDTISGFQAGRYDTLVCHPASIAHGATLTAARYAIYFSHSFSYEQYHQSRERIHRAGQTRKCTYYHLIAEDTVDEAEMRVVRRKGENVNAFREALKKGMA